MNIPKYQYFMNYILRKFRTKIAVKLKTRLTQRHNRPAYDVNDK